MIRYRGSGPYCYANSLGMVLGDIPVPAVEVLTGSPFGMHFEESGKPYFDPAGWDPDLGLEAAIDLLGWSCERSEGGSADEALARLRDACGSGPVMVGPVDIGLLTHQPWSSGTAIGADHWVVVLEVGDSVLMHDPDGFPFATLPIEQFMLAWRAEKVPFTASYVLRTDFRPVRAVTVDDALRASIPRAAEWLSSDSAGAVHRLAELLAAGIDPELQQHLAGFAVRVGVRRLDDAATWLDIVGADTASAIARDQARILGGLQYPLVRGEFSTAAGILPELAPGYSALRTALLTTHRNDTGVD
ncbi:hypothetical protein [Kribbella sp. NPDC055071]